MNHVPGRSQMFPHRRGSHGSGPSRILTHGPAVRRPRTRRRCGTRWRRTWGVWGGFIKWEKDIKWCPSFSAKLVYNFITLIVSLGLNLNGIVNQQTSLGGATSCIYPSFYGLFCFTNQTYSAIKIKKTAWFPGKKKHLWWGRSMRSL